MENTVIIIYVKVLFTDSQLAGYGPHSIHCNFFQLLSFNPAPAVEGLEHNFLTLFVAAPVIDHSSWGPISPPTIKLQRLGDDITGVEGVISSSETTG